MSYCRFSDGDVYLFHNIQGHYECCACRLAPLVDTVATKGYARHELFKKCPACEGAGCAKCNCRSCNGAGCPSCQMHDSMNMGTPEDALKHLQKHKDAGHVVPEYAISRLQKEIAESKS